VQIKRKIKVIGYLKLIEAAINHRYKKAKQLKGFEKHE
jgi:hypothetical protein